MLGASFKARHKLVGREFPRKLMNQRTTSSNGEEPDAKVALPRLSVSF